ncbi:hypothetical protein AYI69_g6750 [Smittium culicis]|uniref:Uncharacterized protein n=1 Tax=Smittium culicis TaxID=133412 RepID=A0A1R1XWT0_9FUNG|nr:hypothetical protein AYI69_g6750 [Smittium culicis]
MVKELLWEKERNTEPQESYVTTKIPITDLAVYPELIEALPSIEEDFFRTPLAEEERKEAIHSCSVNSRHNYIGIPVVLVQATHLIVYYANRIIQENQKVNENDTHILFIITMRVLFSNIAFTVTQGRFENLNKAAHGSGKLEALIASKKKERFPGYASPFAGTSSMVRKTIPAANLLKRKSRKLHLRSSHLTNTPRSKIFMAEKVDLIRSLGWSPVKGSSRDVPFCMGQNNGQLLGTHHRREMIPDSVKEEGTSFEGFVGSMTRLPSQLMMTGPLQLTLNPRRYKRKINSASHAVLTQEFASLLTNNAVEQVKSRSPGLYRNLLELI